MKITIASVISLGLLFSNTEGVQQIRSINDHPVFRFEDKDNVCYVIETPCYGSCASISCVKGYQTR